jgi:hypothetical protein
MMRLLIAAALLWSFTVQTWAQTPPAAATQPEKPKKAPSKKPANPAEVANVQIPNDRDALQCAVPLFARRLQIGPTVLDCSQYVRVEGAKIIDRGAENGGTADMLTEVTLKSLDEFASTSIVASTCTGTTWQANIAANQHIVLTTILTFRIFSRQAICETQAIGKIIKGNVTGILEPPPGTSMPADKMTALQFITSLHPDCQWLPNGLIFNKGDTPTQNAYI